jgi:hypothetical protein
MDSVLPPRRAPHVVGFHPVAVSVVETNPLGRILADRVFPNRIPIALAIPAIKIDAIGIIPADGAIGNGVPIALAITGAIKSDAISKLGKTMKKMMGEEQPAAIG